MRSLELEVKDCLGMPFQMSFAGFVAGRVMDGGLKEMRLLLGRMAVVEEQAGCMDGLMWKQKWVVEEEAGGAEAAGGSLRRWAFHSHSQYEEILELDTHFAEVEVEEVVVGQRCCEAEPDPHSFADIGQAVAGMPQDYMAGVQPESCSVAWVLVADCIAVVEGHIVVDCRRTVQTAEGARALGHNILQHHCYCRRLAAVDVLTLGDSYTVLRFASLPCLGIDTGLMLAHAHLN